MRIILFFLLLCLDFPYWANNIAVDSIFLKVDAISDTSKKIHLLASKSNQLVNVNNQKSKEYINKALELTELFNKDTSILIEVYQTKGHLETSEANYDVAIEYLLKAYQLAKHITNYNTLANITNSLGNCYTGIDDVEGQKKFYNLTLEYGQKANNPQHIALGNLGYALALENINEYDSALVYHKNSLEIFKSINRSDAILASIINITHNYIRQEQPDSAQQYFNEGFAYLNQKNVYLIAQFHISYAEFLYQKEKYTEALKNIEYSIPLLVNLNSISNIIPARILYAEILLKLKQHDKAIEEYKLALALKDSLYSDSKLKYIEEMNTKYETYEKELKILSQNQLINTQKASILEKDLRHGYDTKIRTYLIIGCIIIVFIAFYIYSRFRVINKQKKLIETQKHEIEEKNLEVLASINYALKIQKAMLPSTQKVSSYFPNNFIFYQPKDIVAGDFYWTEKTGQITFLAACDCTGHGVPGAMVSVVCHNALNRAVKEFQLTSPGKILDKAREIVVQEFKDSDDGIKDGMDIALIAINQTNQTLSFAGAHNSLYRIRESELIEVKGNKQPVGKYTTPIPFKTEELKIKKGDQFYLTTDGYYDQFGGEKGKKFKSKNFKELLIASANLPINEQKDKIVQNFHSWKSDYEQLDDVCVIGFSI